MAIVLDTCVPGTGLGARQIGMDEPDEAPALRSCGAVRRDRQRENSRGWEVCDKNKAEQWEASGWRGHV